MVEVILSFLRRWLNPDISLYKAAGCITEAMLVERESKLTVCHCMKVGAEK